MVTVETLEREVGVKAACEALSLPRATFYRARGETPPWVTARHRPPLTLTPQERATALEALNEERFVDHASPTVYAALLGAKGYRYPVRVLYHVRRQSQRVHKSEW